MAWLLGDLESSYITTLCLHFLTGKIESSSRLVALSPGTERLTDGKPLQRGLVQSEGHARVKCEAAGSETLKMILQ